MSFIARGNVAGVATAITAVPGAPAAAVLAAAGAGAQTPSTPSASACPAAPDPSALPSAPQLKQMNSYVAKLGARPTGSRAHARYIAWIRKQLKTIPGLETSDLSYRINRWSARRTTLELRAGGKVRKLAVAGPVPYSKPTGRRGA